METTPSSESLGGDLPQPWELPSTVRQTFELVHVHGGIAYISGHGPVSGTEILMSGKVGSDLSVEDGYQSARLTALAVAASLRRVLPSLESVAWLRATVYVNAVPGLGGPALTRVADGFSDVIKEIYGDRVRVRRQHSKLFGAHRPSRRQPFPPRSSGRQRQERRRRSSPVRAAHARRRSR